MVENLPVKLNLCKNIAESTYEVVFEYDQNLFSFSAGQYVRITIPKLKFEDPKGNSRDFSIASFPNIKGSFSIAFRNTGSGFKRTLIEAEKGFMVEITGPQGIFSFKEMEGKSAVFIAGGIGITPFLSILRFATEQKLPLKIILLYGNSNKESAAYIEELKKLEEENPNFKMVILFTHITKDAIKQQIEDITDKYFYLAGPPEMTTSAAKELLAMGIEDKAISIEEFSGYAKTPPVSDDAFKMKIEARFDALLAAVEKIAIVSTTDIKGNITYVNDKFIEISKYSKDELMGQNHRIIKSGYHDEAFYKNLWDTISAGKIWHGEIKNKAKDNTFYWVDSSISSTFDEKGKIIGYVAVRFPITEAKKLEEKLLESEHRLSLNILNAPMGIIEWDKDFQVAGWNTAAEKIFGYSKDEAMGKHANFIIPDEFKPQVDQIWSQLISGGANQSTNGNITKDGRVIVCEWHNAPLTTSDGKVFGVISMVLDVTQAKKAEENLKSKNEELEKMNQLMVGRELKMIELKKQIEEMERLSRGVKKGEGA